MLRQLLCWLSFVELRFVDVGQLHANRSDSQLLPDFHPTIGCSNTPSLYSPRGAVKLRHSSGRRPTSARSQRAGLEQDRALYRENDNTFVLLSVPQKPRPIRIRSEEDTTI